MAVTVRRDWMRASDEELLRASKSDADAFACFYRRYEVAMLSYFKRRTGDAELAADLCAEVFAAALASSGRFRRGRTPAAAWLFGIAEHKLISSWRKGRVADRARRQLAMEPVALTDEDLERVDDRVSAFDVEELLADLPADQRDAVRARVLEERDYPDIAQELQCSPMVVRKRVSRGLRQLRERFEGGSS